MLVWLGVALSLALLRRVLDLPATKRGGWLGRTANALSSPSVSPFVQTAVLLAVAAGAFGWWHTVPGEWEELLPAGTMALVVFELLLRAALPRPSATQRSLDPRPPVVEMRAPGFFGHFLPLHLFGVATAMLFVLMVGPKQGLERAFPDFIHIYPLVLWVASLLTMWTPRADVGTDGMYIWGLRRRFVPFTGREKVLPRPWGFEIQRDQRTLARLWALHRKDARDPKELLDRLVSKVTRPHATPAGTAALTLIGRSEDASPHANESQYREGSVARDDLWRVAASPVAEPRLRIAAAKELIRIPQQNDEARLHALAEECAHPETRETFLALRSNSDPS